MQKHHKIIAIFNGYGRILMNHKLNSNQWTKNNVAIIGLLTFMFAFTFLLLPQLKQEIKCKQGKQGREEEE